MNPHITFLCEIYSQDVIDHVIEYLKHKGKIYYGNFLGGSASILSKYPMKASVVKSGIAKATMVINGHSFAVYSIHFDHRYAGEYYPRGYDGQNFEKLNESIVDELKILEYARKSARLKQTNDLVFDINKEIEGRIIIIGGDFNEPSHLDWMENTKNIRDHNGAVVKWECSRLLQHNGFKDAYREIYSDAVTHPAFTFAAGNNHPDISESKLRVINGEDNRERIDLIYYFPDKRLKLTDVAIVGPKEDFLDGIVLEKTKDNIIIPNSGLWMSDHKGNYAEWELLTVGRME